MTEINKTKYGMDKQQPLRHELAEVALFGQDLEINGQMYHIIANVRDALDIETLRNKYDPYLDQYDYIVGDVSSQHLRLKGFYEKASRYAIDKKALTIVDYLTEYCNPGIPYFILERVSKVHSNNIDEDEYFWHPKPKFQISKSRRNNNQYHQKKIHKTKFSKSYAVKRNKHAFIIKKRES